MKNSRFVVFIFLLAGLLAIAFAVHYSSSLEAFRGELFLTYSFNFFLTILFLVIFLLKEKAIKPYLGYYFLYFSLFKFILFLAVIQPLLDRTGGVKGHAFFSFFIPYALCVVLEIRFVIKELNTSY